MKVIKIMLALLILIGWVFLTSLLLLIVFGIDISYILLTARVGVVAFIATSILIVIKVMFPNVENSLETVQKALLRYKKTKANFEDLKERFGLNGLGDKE